MAQAEKSLERGKKQENPMQWGVFRRNKKGVFLYLGLTICL